jgi:preprotein translocase subunit SecA
MYTTIEKPVHFFPKEQPAHKELAGARANVLKQFDFSLFQEQSLELIKKYDNEEAYLQWQLFCNHVKQLNENKAEKMLLMQTAFHCLQNPMEQGDLAQLITLTRHLKALDGLQLVQILLQAKVPKEQRQLQTYLAVFQLGSRPK